MSKGIIYYTHNPRLDPPIIEMAQKYISKAQLPIISVSLKPIPFGKNFVLNDRKRGVYTLTLQIITALEKSTSKNIFFCEHDVLYHASHFDFIPHTEDTFYYNTHVWRWRYHTRKTVTHSDLISLSGLCCNRDLALRYFHLYKKFLERNTDIHSDKQSRIVRDFGFEPGASTNGKYGFKAFKFDTWKSKYPNVDIRHRFCFTNRKTEIDQLVRVPEDWTESTIDSVSGWKLNTLFADYIFE